MQQDMLFSPQKRPCHQMVVPPLPLACQEIRAMELEQEHQSELELPPGLMEQLRLHHGSWPARSKLIKDKLHAHAYNDLLIMKSV